MNVIEATALGKRYGSTRALRECSLAIPEGHVAALVGPNGAGKSTLLNLAVGLSAPSEGGLTVLLDAMIAAPEFHTVLFENDRVRVLDGRVAPGATVPVHTHRWGGGLYILATSDFVRRDPDGNVLADTRASKSTPILGSSRLGRTAHTALSRECRYPRVPHTHCGDEGRG